MIEAGFYLVRSRVFQKTWGRRILGEKGARLCFGLGFPVAYIVVEPLVSGPLGHLRWGLREQHKAAAGYLNLTAHSLGRADEGEDEY